MKPKILPRGKPAAGKLIRINKDAWAEKSQGGLAYIFAGEFYEDQPFTCRACGCCSVFTAEQQQYTYEVKKAPVDEQHVLCAVCFRQRNRLVAESAELAAGWLQNKVALKNDHLKLRRWKEVLEILPKYGVRKDSARIRMLAKLLQPA